MTRTDLSRRSRPVALLVLLLAVLLGVYPHAALAAGPLASVFLPLVTSGAQNLAAAGGSAGAVYVLTNQAGGNAVAMYRRSAAGLLEAAGVMPTGGTGTGAGIGSQGALMLSDDGRWLLAVNPGSNDVSVFDVRPDGLLLTARTGSGGAMPISVTVHKDLVYVLNGGGAGNITGFRLGSDGSLVEIENSTRSLSAAGTGPAEVSFSPDGATLIVTEKATNQLLAYSVDADGYASGPVVYPSSGATPFGFAFTRQGTLVVSEAFGGAPLASAVSSYAVAQNVVQVVSASMPTGQTAACWIAVTPNGRFAYSTNAGSGSVSAYALGPDGSLVLIDGRAGVTGDGTGPIDAMVSHDGQYLYVLNSRVPSIAIFAIQSDGTLFSMGAVAGLQAGTVGMAAW